MNQLYEKAFKAYDIRGIYGTEIDEKFSYCMGKALALYMKDTIKDKKNILIGSDVRDANVDLVSYFVKGLNEEGIEDITYAKLYTDQRYVYGICSTSFLYYLGENDFAMSVSFTASHNPAEYVGMKMFDKQVNLLSTSVLKEYFMRVYSENITLPEVSVQTGGDTKSIIDKQQGLFAILEARWNELTKNHKFVVDFSQGAAVAGEKKFFTDYLSKNHMINLINDMPDGQFSAHPSETTEPENFHQLIEEVKKQGAEFGVMFDGDADRLGFVTAEGNMVTGDIITAIIAKQLLSENDDEDDIIDDDPKTILYETMSSKIIPEIVEQYGGTSYMTRVGRYFIKEELHKRDALFAGEVSGHFLFEEFGGYEMPLLALYYVVKELENFNDFASMIRAYTKYYKGPVISCLVENTDLVLEKIKQKYVDYEQKYVDGISVYGPDFRCNVRKSNTESKIRFTVEADTQQQRQTRVDEIQALITS